MGVDRETRREHGALDGGVRRGEQEQKQQEEDGNTLLGGCPPLFKVLVTRAHGPEAFYFVCASQPCLPAASPL